MLWNITFTSAQTCIQPSVQTTELNLTVLKGNIKKIVHLFTGKQIMSRIETYNVKTLKMMQACKQVH